ncbi:MAG: LysM peptidoglycan-binding domain-containing protein [Candidatus Ozemobacteraceae bacterium]
MLLFNGMRAKDALIAIFLGLTLALAPLPAAARGQVDTAPAAEYADPNGLDSPPPQIAASKVVAAPLGNQDYRPPIEPPAADVPVSMAPRAARRVPVANVSSPKQAFYVVQAGDTAPLISKKIFGTSGRWGELLAMNGISDPSSLRIGQTLKLSGGEPVFRAAAPAEASSAGTGSAAHKSRKMVQTSADYEVPAPEEEAETGATVAQAKGKASGLNTKAKASISADVEDADATYYGQNGGSYTIQRGDTLPKIAKKLLGSSKRWREIAKVNPKLDANKLLAGQSIIIPGAGSGDASPGAMAIAKAPVAGSPTSFDAGSNAPPPGMAPSFEPPPVAPPPMDGAATNAYPGMMTPPPVMVPPGMEPPPPLGMAMPPVAGGTGGAAVMPTTQALYHEAQYRLPDELKPTDITPYFTNFNGYYGLFSTECALYPYIKTWHVGFNFRYDKYKYLNGRDSVIDGRQWIAPLNVMYTGRKLMVGLTVPFQNWEVTRSGGGYSTVGLSEVHDPELKAGYQIWKNLEGTHAVSLHVAGRFSSGNYHQPYWTMLGKTTTNVRVGPAGATRGSWTEFGGAYTGKLSERWSSHLNFALANDSDDSITKWIYRGLVDYRVNHNFSLIGELDGSMTDMNNGPDGGVLDFLFGMALYNEGWEAILGFPMSLQSDWNYGHDFGVTVGVNARWD